MASAGSSIERLERLAQRMKEGEARFDAGWNRIRNVFMAIAAFIAFGIFAPLGSQTGGLQGFAVFLVGMLITLGPIYGVSHFFREQFKSKHGVSGTDKMVILACAELDQLPDELAEPVVRAVTAYTGMSRIGGDALWERSGFPIQRHMTAAANQVLQIIATARRLGTAAPTISRLAHGGDTEALQEFQRQCLRLSDAAGRFQQVEAGMTRTFVALAGATEPANTELQELEHSFAALSEVLAVSQPDEQVLRLGGGQ